MFKRLLQEWKGIEPEGVEILNKEGSNLLQNIVFYIGGYVVSKVTTDKCRTSLIRSLVCPLARVFSIKKQWHLVCNLGIAAKNSNEQKSFER